MSIEDPKPFEPEAPQPLVPDLRPPRPYPVEALGSLAEAVECVRAITQAPAAIAAQSALAVASLCVQGHVDVETLGGDRPTSLYAITLAKSGERKSSCDRLLMEPLLRHEEERIKATCAAKSEAELKREIWKTERSELLKKIRCGGSEKAEAEKALAKLSPEPSLPPAPQRLVSEPTFEGLTRVLADGQSSVGVFSDEGGQFLGGHAMNRDNMQKTVTAFNGLWDGSPIRRTRQGDGHMTLLGRRVAMHLMVQPGLASDFLANAIAVESGFLPRALICEPESTIGSRLHQPEAADRSALHAFHEKVSQIMGREEPMDPVTRALKPHRLPLSDGARKRLIEYYNGVEKAQAKGGMLDHITGTASKSPEQAARIAGVLCAFRNLDAAEVSEADMEAGIALARYYLLEAVRLSENAQISDSLAKAEMLREWLVEDWPHADWVPSEAYQLGPGSLRSMDKIKPLIPILLEHGWLVPLDPWSEVRGKKRKIAFRIVGKANGGD